MRLEYLLFDASEEDSGACSFDAMASVLPPRLTPLLQEVAAVLGWAYRAFGAPSNGGDEGEWDFELQASDEHDAALEIACDVARAQVSLPRTPAGRVTLALTVSGSPAFAEAFRDAFPESD
ncbi:MAG TPA: hypothetical protein VFM98_13385 [Ramlibacter sp.]|uniref:hypothetical protein n=1 Tax=Ramlibacter sp. TaxID=1917967 RepID=UPI002D7E509C|nr:hypothetical protein [Ramlibacter sp.]HET8746594.1 hypothetical protein [Ramlibacter sp.]